MIYQIRGKVEYSTLGFLVLDVGGVGFGIYVPEYLTNSKLKEGVEIKLFTVTLISGNEINIYGFNRTLDREFFKLLMGIPKIGPKVAMRILSRSSASKIIRSILLGDTKSLERLPGVGKKTAQRIVMELKEKVKGMGEEGEEETSLKEVIEVLVDLGCSKEEARRVMEKVVDRYKGNALPNFQTLLDDALLLMSVEGM